MKTPMPWLRPRAVALAAAVATTLVAGARPASAAKPAKELVPNWGLSVRTGPYQPRVGNTVEHDFYKFIYANGDSSIFSGHPLATTLELDFYLAKDFGIAGWYAQVGYWRAQGSTRLCTSGGEPVDCTPETLSESTPGNDKTELMIFPFGVGAIYKMDVLKRRLAVPLVPYVKAGVDYYLWRNTVGGKISSRPANPEVGTNAVRGAGGTWGLSGTAGLALNLDWIEPSAAASAHTSVGMTDSYLFMEASYLWANGFNDSDRFDMSGAIYEAGIAFDFH